MKRKADNRRAHIIRQRPLMVFYTYGEEVLLLNHLKILICQDFQYFVNSKWLTLSSTCWYLPICQLHERASSTCESLISPNESSGMNVRCVKTSVPSTITNFAEGNCDIYIPAESAGIRAKILSADLDCLIHLYPNTRKQRLPDICRISTLRGSLKYKG